MSALRLSEIQSRFQQLLRGEFHATDPAWLSGRDTPPINYQRRIGIYHAAGEMRFEDGLLDDFPRLFQVLGKKRYDALVKAYLQAYPSRYHSICELGQDLSGFLASAAGEPWRDLPYLSELARFEWTRNLAYWAINLPPLDREAMQRLAAEDPERLILELHPSVFLFESEWQVDRLGTKQALSARSDSTGVQVHQPWCKAGPSVHKRCPRHGVRLVVFRHEGRVNQRRLTKKAWTLLGEIQKGKSLGGLETCMIANRIAPDAALSLIAAWVEDSIIASFRRQP